MIRDETDYYITTTILSYILIDLLACYYVAINLNYDFKKDSKERIVKTKAKRGKLD